MQYLSHVSLYWSLQGTLKIHRIQANDNHRLTSVKCTSLIPYLDAFNLLCPLPPKLFLQNFPWFSFLLFSSKSLHGEALPASPYKVVSPLSVPLSHFTILFTSWHLSLRKDLPISVLIISLPHNTVSSKKAEIIFSHAAWNAEGT